MPREKRCVENSLRKSRVHFSWQAQYLVKLECDFSWQAQHLVTLGDSRSAKCCIFPYKIRLQDGTSCQSDGQRVTFSCAANSQYSRALQCSSEPIALRGINYTQLYMHGSATLTLPLFLAEATAVKFRVTDRPALSTMAEMPTLRLLRPW